ncbi:MAG TPA: NAD-dependent DNA ligase LigA, partial [Thermotogota bacterium]|nr:NAD-dependent DNA ligase LigA [Thermotogota bacterium]
MDLSLDNVKTEIARLREEIERHNYAYHVLASPTISDKDYDELFRRLLALERQYPQYDDPNSPTRKVGAPVLEGF